MVEAEVLEHECVQCGKWYQPERNDSAYCQARCRVAAYRERCKSRAGARG